MRVLQYVDLRQLKEKKPEQGRILCTSYGIVPYILQFVIVLLLLLVLVLILVTQIPNFASKLFGKYCALTTGLACSGDSFWRKARGGWSFILLLFSQDVCFYISVIK